MVFSVLKRATGIDLLEDLSEFFSSFGDMTEGFRERAERVNALLADSRSAFVLVTSPARRRGRGGRSSSTTACWTPGCRSRASWRTACSRPAPRGDPAAELDDLLGEPSLARKVLRTLEDERRLAAQRPAVTSADLAKLLGRKPMIEVPHLDDDVHDLAGLRRMDEYLFG